MKKKSCLRKLLVLGGILAVIATIGYVRNGVSGATHALNLPRLPFTSVVTVHASESWTDYMFECEMRIRPNDFEELISGRDFKLDQNSYYIGQKSSAYRILLYKGFEVAEVWSWSQTSDDYMPTTCRILVNENKTRLYLTCQSD